MTFIAPGTSSPSPARFFVAPRRLARVAGRRSVFDEQGARLALGGDHAAPPSAPNGAAIEHLARIALG